MMRLLLSTRRALVQLGDVVVEVGGAAEVDEVVEVGALTAPEEENQKVCFRLEACEMYICGQ